MEYRMTKSVEEARRFVSSATLPAPVARHFALTAASTFDFDEVKQQAAVVGGQVISFVKGITAEQRQDIVNASLFAYLFAKKQHPQLETLTDVTAWYNAYFEALSRVGLVMQDTGFTEYTANTDTFEAHQAILDVASALLASSPGALVLVKTTLTALQKMNADSPWITLFNRESHSAHAARFQLSLVTQDEGGALLISLLAFALEARSTLTQVLFFKFRKESVTLRHNEGRVTIDVEVLVAIRNDLSKKLVAFASDFIRATDL
jgi:hypothetical protein